MDIRYEFSSFVYLAVLMNTETTNVDSHIWINLCTLRVEWISVSFMESVMISWSISLQFLLILYGHFRRASNRVCVHFN